LGWYRSWGGCRDWCFRRGWYGSVGWICNRRVGGTAIYIALAKVRNAKWILVSIFLPTVETFQFKRTFNWLVLNRRVVPMETQKVAATSFQYRAVEGTAVAVLGRILTIEHPRFTRRKASVFSGFEGRTDMGKGILGHIKSRYRNIKMDLIAGTRGVLWWAQIGCLEHNGGSGCWCPWNIGGSSQLVACTTARPKPLGIVTKEYLRDSGGSIESCTVLVSSWCGKHGIRVAMSRLAVLSR